MGKLGGFQHIEIKPRLIQRYPPAHPIASTFFKEQIFGEAGVYILKITTKTLTKDLWIDFEKYFEFQSGCSGCWCMNHRMPIGMDFNGEAAKLAMKQLVEGGRVFGILAYAEGVEIPVGWTSLDRRKTLPGHDCIGEDIKCNPSVWSIHCVTTRVDYKNKGIEKKMIGAAIDLAKALQAIEIESYPEPDSQEGHSFRTWNTFNGFQDNYEEFGFRKIQKDFGPQSEFFHPMKLNIID